MPKNEGALNAGDSEMTAAARMHGEPLMKLNQLTRWYITTALLVLVLIPVFVLLTATRVITVDFSTMHLIYAIVNLVTASLLFLAGGLGIKFLPSAMGGNPHVYSLSMALWSYWLILAGTILGMVFPFVDYFSTGASVLYTRIGGGLYGITMLAGAILLLFNLSRTMEQRI